ncbi:MAG TPA: hypothetical protein VKV26_01990 [Dehalococcoidia bacterium]|nr:hypothetical protein [Dehalococcoidia bacterium]
MPVWLWIVIIVAIVVAVLIVIAAIVSLALRRRQTSELREGFGPEYDRTVNAYGDRRRAEDELQARRQRVEGLQIHPLEANDRRRFADEWHATQAHFVDEPGHAIAEADRLVQQAMTARGYPVGDFDQRAADVSVDHANVVRDYRQAHAISERNERGEATTEDLRQAMVHYRSLFDDLLAA